MKVVIIGCGNVGMSYAYALVNQQSRVSELVLIDINTNRVEGEALDLNHALPFAPSRMKIKSGNYSDCNNADIICINAGRNQNPGESRMDLISKNVEVFKDIISKIKQTNFKGIYLISTNPVDVMCHVTYKLTNNSKKIVGSGTALDTARLKYLIGEKLGISTGNIHAYAVGEHGDSILIPWSNATVGLSNIKEFLNQNEMADFLTEVKNSAADIINKKGNTSYGIGVVLLTITNSILNNDNKILTLSTYDSKRDIFISRPTIVNKNGVKKTFKIDFSLEENIAYENSIQKIRQALNNIKH